MQRYGIRLLITLASPAGNVNFSRFRTREDSREARPNTAESDSEDESLGSGQLPPPTRDQVSSYL